jgi:hypothetical protein
MNTLKTQGAVKSGIQVVLEEETRRILPKYRLKAWLWPNRRNRYQYREARIIAGIFELL